VKVKCGVEERINLRNKSSFSPHIDLFLAKPDSELTDRCWEKTADRQTDRQTGGGGVRRNLNTNLSCRRSPSVLVDYTVLIIKSRLCGRGGHWPIEHQTGTQPLRRSLSMHPNTSQCPLIRVLLLFRKQAGLHFDILFAK